MCFSVIFAQSSIFTEPMLKIEVLIFPFSGAVHSLPMPLIPFLIPRTEPTVAPLQSVSNPV